MSNLIRARFRSFSKAEKGATMFEYAILVGVIALVAIGGATVFGNDLHNLFTSQGTSVSTTNSTAPALTVVPLADPPLNTISEPPPLTIALIALPPA